MILRLVISLALATLASASSVTPPSPRLRGGKTASCVVYTTPGCAFCTRAKTFLNARDVAYEEYDVSVDRSKLEEMLSRAGRSTLPQIFVGGEHIGGCDDLLAEHNAGTLKDRFERAGIVVLDEPPPPSNAAAATTAAAAIPRSPVGAALNPVIGGGRADAGDASAVAARLQRSMLELTEAHLLDDGSRVDYDTLRSSAEFARFCSAVGELGALPAAALADGADESERTAFWINVYNTLVIHGVVAVGAPEDGAERARFFSGESGVVYRVAGACFSLDDIEHGILRANAPPHGRRRAEPCFASGDARQLYSLRKCDARVHFALNCGARSCPPIRIYSAAHLDDELGLAARAFVESEVDVPSAADRPSRVRASRLLEWYASDFGATDADVVATLRGYLPPDAPLAAALGAALDHADAAGGGPELEFSEYNWALNEAPKS